MTNVTCGLTAKKLGSAPSPTLLTEYGTSGVWKHKRQRIYVYIYINLRLVSGKQTNQCVRVK